MFQKMDADGDGTLSWDEYISFLSQQQAHLWEQVEHRNVPYIREQCSSVYPIGNKHIEKLELINGEYSAKLAVNSAKYCILTL